MLTKTATYHFRAKRKSELFQNGEGDPHIKAKMRVAGIIDKWIKDSKHYITTACIVEVEVKLAASYELYYLDTNGQKVVLLPEFIDPRRPEAGRKRFFHPFDILVKLVHLNKLVEWIFVEVDGRWHEKLKVKVRDRYIEEKQQQLLPDARLVRIHIADAKALPPHEIVQLVIKPRRRQ